MQYPDYYKKYDRPAIPQKPQRNWGGPRANSGRKHNWQKSDYPLKPLNLPAPLRQKIKQLRDSGVPVEDMIFNLEQ